MVICDGAMVVNLMASAMMNGACCMHAMQEEETRKREHHEAIRKVINVEWERQRLLEREYQEQMFRERQFDAASVLADERRRLLMTTKLRASLSRQSSSQVSVNSSKEYDDDQGPNEFSYWTDSSLPGVPPPTRHLVRPALGRMTSPSSIQHRIRSVPIQDATFSRAGLGRIPLVVGERGEYYREIARSTSAVSSLLDEDDSDYDSDDDSDFIRAALQ